LPNRLTFEGPVPPSKPDAPSNIASIQKFMWWDTKYGRPFEPHHHRCPCRPHLTLQPLAVCFRLADETLRSFTTYSADSQSEVPSPPFIGICLEDALR
jgi:hypothetical protein